MLSEVILTGPELWPHWSRQKLGTVRAAWPLPPPKAPATRPAQTAGSKKLSAA